MNAHPEKSALALLSGGLDSTTILYIAREQGYALHALSFDYGQRHSRELDAARRTASEAGVVRHTILRLDPALFQNTALVGTDIDVPRDREIDEEIPVTYVPARNILFLAHALALAESHGIGDIFIGVNALDYSGYPDCRPEFLEAFEKAAALGMKTGALGSPVRIRAPLINMTKADIIREGTRLGVDYSLTMSCYDPDESGRPCGRCDSCILRAKGFEEAGQSDPLISYE